MTVHFGMSGRFSTHLPPGPAATATTRLRLESPGVVAMLSAMTVDYGGPELFQTKRAQLGPDPLREDADGELLWRTMQATKRPVGAILMDQSCVAGIGNIYRAEILFKAGVHPEQPSHTVSRAQFDSIWRHSVDLLQRGFQTGSILTVDASEGLPEPWTRRYIYNQASCGRCHAAVRTWDMATRKVYACETCQPLVGDVLMSAKRAEKHAQAVDARLFVSHCAPDSGASVTPAKMTVAQLRAALEAMGEGDIKGGKAALLARLLAKEKPSDAAPMRTGAAPVRTGTAHLVPASAAEAAADKLRAGESAAVEHVALADDDVLALKKAAAAARTKRPAVAEEDVQGLGGSFRKRR